MARLEIELNTDEEYQLTEAARRRGMTLPDYARRQLMEAVAPDLFVAAVPIWKQAAAIGAGIPESDRTGLPHDGSINYEHYLYQAPTIPLPEME